MVFELTSIRSGRRAARSGRRVRGAGGPARHLRWLGALGVAGVLSASVHADTPGRDVPAWRAVPAVTFDARPASPPAPQTGLRGLSPIPAPIVPVPGDPGTTLYITPENPQGVLVWAAPGIAEARVGATAPRALAPRATAAPRRSYTLSDALREAAWRQKTADRLEAIGVTRNGL